MNKPIILSALTSFFVVAAILFMAEGSNEARASLPPAPDLTVVKGGRVAVTDAYMFNDDQDDESAEWTLDCLDQFGPNGGAPNARDFNSCMNQPG
ncbi:hypothetical protein [Rhizobium halophytocola]|uniref:Uncharacterized SAM-binding protein YcdF (DUF218 family) n=1 Tax=Rhizobium halophytocola TaxID=735519 RepID=A0ABS4E6C3_9HYPH|nr:hypothetical protein [Rhizobium halophytocola]MBP1853494.1 uncharacterized SAM-binding protein YcdF (DUF218 family) [Rhizobium halophytocola]